MAKVSAANVTKDDSGSIVRSLTLHKNQITFNSPYRMQVTASAVGDVDPNIFVYLQRVDDPNSDVTSSRFDHVAVPSDLEDFPIGSPIVGAPELFFRLSTVDFLVRDVNDLQEIWETLKSHTAMLYESLEQIQTLTQTAEITVTF